MGTGTSTWAKMEYPCNLDIYTYQYQSDKGVCLFLGSKGFGDRVDICHYVERTVADRFIYLHLSIWQPLCKFPMYEILVYLGHIPLYSHIFSIHLPPFQTHIRLKHW